AHDPLRTCIRFLWVAGVFYLSVGAGADTQRAAASHGRLVWSWARRSDSGVGNIDGDHDEPDQGGESGSGCGRVYACAVSRHRLFYGYVRFGDLLAKETGISPSIGSDRFVCADCGGLGTISFHSR